MVQEPSTFLCKGAEIHCDLGLSVLLQYIMCKPCITDTIATAKEKAYPLATLSLAESIPAGDDILFLDTHL